MTAVAALACGRGARAEEAADQASAPPADDKQLPLPFITIEGQGGGAFTPLAYLVNPPRDGEMFGRPSVAFDYVGLGQKNLEALLVTENLWGRIEFGFAADRLGLGSLPSDITRTIGVDIDESDVWLYNFSARALLVKENANGTLWLPAVTAGAILKYNANIASINDRLGGALTAIGYDHDTSVDFTLTATKTIPKAILGQLPLIATVGLRESQGADLGFLGFADQYRASFEGSLATFASKRLMIAYEFRQQTSPYGTIGPGGTIDVPNLLIGDENNWHAFSLAYILSEHATLVGGMGIFGNLANAEANTAWWLQAKYEF